MVDVSRGERAMRSRAIALLLGAVLSTVVWALSIEPGRAALSHSTVEKEFSIGADCPAVVDLTVLESTGTIYAMCSNSGGGPGTLHKFDLEGNPVSFSGSGPFISGNEITGSPTSPTGALGTRIAVDNSDAHNGFIYVVSGEYTNPASTNVDVFNPAGEWINAIANAGAFQSRTDVDVGPDGSIYVIQDGFRSSSRVSKYNASFKEVARVYTLQAGKFVRVDSTGAVWTRLVSVPPKISRYEADQFSSNLGVTFGSPESLVDSVEASPSPLFPDPLLKSPDLRNFDVDPVNDDLYVNRANRIETYSRGSAEEAPHQVAPAFGAGTLTGSEAIAVTADHRVYASKGGSIVVRFGPGDILPDIATPRPASDDVGHTSAIVKAHIDPAGGTNVTSCQVEYGFTAAYKSAGSGVVPCSPDPSGGAFGTAADVSAVLPALSTGTIYHYRFKAGNAKGSNFGIDRTVVPAYVLKVRTSPATEVADHGALLQGSFDPDGISTSFHFEYGVDDSYGLRTPEVDAGDGTGVRAVQEALDNLPAGKVWHYRIAAKNSGGTTFGEDQVFKTAGAPDISGLRATEVGASSATLHARIDPVGYATKYHFEYGTTPAYGQAAPIPDGEIEGEAGPLDKDLPITGLRPGVTYHYRVVASNQWGTSASLDTTFDFAPPSCPNDHVRQQTGSSYLPDCRAYELVSPESSGAVQLIPSKAAWDRLLNSPYGEGNKWVLNSGFATSPSRFSFFSNGGVVKGLDGPNTNLDMYMASRTNSGWVTTLPGFTGSVTSETDRMQCSETMALCVDHLAGSADHTPHLFTAEGSELGQLPENVQTLPSGPSFTGSQRMSGDFRHFLFSSADVVFAPGGVSGGQGSAYDNDIGAHTVTLISKLPNGANIPQDGSKTRAIEFPGLSPDGSHVLMQTPASNGQSHLYMRVNQSITFEIAPETGVTLAGATRNGSQVLFTSAERLTDEDDDSSVDLYAWSEAGELGGNPLTLLSVGNERGNTDECTATWTDGCGIELLSTERGNPGGLASIPGLDDKLAEVAGDVYFYSPELLDPVSPGIPGQRNLYVSHGGTLQLVDTLDPGTQIDRIQISPDGRHAAFVTESRLTSYDNKAYKQMYAYDVAGGQIRCSSCNPKGLAPSADVEASEGGRFMSNDGRTFFATKDSLVSRDNNGSIIDVYEYVGGRPQLISSGFGARDFTGGGTVALLTTPEYIGLEGVSRNGVDVYFSTFDTLVSNDQNGARVKFYNARTNGGFPVVADLAPCAAADECHGAGTTTPSAPAAGSESTLGAGGNVATARKSKPSKRKRKKNKRHQQRAQKRGHHG